VDDGTLDPPSELTFLGAVGADAAEHLEIGPPTPGDPTTKSVARVTLRMLSNTFGADWLTVDLFDSAGGPLAAPGPHVFANTAPGPQNIQVDIPIAPVPDVALAGGVFEMVYVPTPNSGITVFDILIEWL
jgi:hypothetical protein